VPGLRTERDGAVLALTLARPERHNALDGDLIAALTQAFADAGEARAVLLRGEGTSFSAGADIDEMRAASDRTAAENLAEARGWQALLEAVDGCPAPVVAAVHGTALGGACGLLACCDIVLAGPGARFGFSEVRLGLVPAVISPFVVERIGSGAARALFLTGERFDGATALRIGLVSELADDLEAAVARVVAALLAAGPEAARIAKRIARAPLPAEETTRLIAELRASSEGQEGLRAFLERRPAAWRDPPGS
jgi:methylglutaconyl-CoA hydratase